MVHRHLPGMLCPRHELAEVHEGTFSCVEMGNAGFQDTPQSFLFGEKPDSIYYCARSFQYGIVTEAF